MHEFKPGDVVRLRSTYGNNYNMTVEGYHMTPGGRLIRVVWFDVKNRLQRDNFSPYSLTLIEKNLNYVEITQVQECCS